MKKDISKEIKEYFSNDNAFQLRYDLSRNRHLLKELIPNDKWEENQIIWYESNSNGIIWKNTKLALIKDTEGSDIYEFESDFITEGKLGFSFKLKEYNVDARFELTYLVYKYPDSTIILSDHIHLLGQSQKAERAYYTLINQELESLGINKGKNSTGITFEALSDLYKKVEKSNDEQVHATSYYFWNELYTSLDIIKELIGEVRFFSKGTSNYAILDGRREPGIHLGRFDRQYLVKASFALQEIYGFWEKLAFLMFQFISPRKVNQKNLSFTKLITEIEKEIGKGNFPFLHGTHSSFNWFNDFNEKDHKGLRNYRHPLVHYKSNNDIHKGNLYASTLNYYIDNISNNEARKELQHVNEKLGEFLITQVDNCEKGFDKLIALINEIPLNYLN